MNSRLPASAETEKPLASALPKHERSGHDVVDLLRAAVVPAKARDHLVEDEQRAVRVAEPLQLVQKAVSAALRCVRPRECSPRSGRDAARTAPRRWRCRCSGTITVSFRIASGMPAFIAVVPMNQSSTEKNGWSAQMAIRSRPV